jgi:phage terminase small subunit
VSKKPPKDKGNTKPKGKNGTPKARTAPAKRGAKMAGPPRADEDLFAGNLKFPNATQAAKPPGKKPKAPKTTDLDDIRAEYAERQQELEDLEEEMRPRGSRGPVALRPLNPRQRAFAEHYIKLGNATQAYKAAGYNGTTPESLQNAASALLGHVGVRAYIGELLDDAATPRIADAQERHEFLADVMRGKVSGVATYYGVPIPTTPDFPSRVKAAELLGKIAGDYVEKKQIEGGISIRIVRGNSAPSAIGEKVGDDD